MLWRLWGPERLPGLRGWLGLCFARVLSVTHGLLSFYTLCQRMPVLRSDFQVQTDQSCQHGQ